MNPSALPETSTAPRAAPEPGSAGARDLHDPSPHASPRAGEGAAEAVRFGDALGRALGLDAGPAKHEAPAGEAATETSHDGSAEDSPRHTGRSGPKRRSPHHAADDDSGGPGAALAGRAAPPSPHATHAMHAAPGSAADPGQLAARAGARRPLPAPGVVPAGAAAGDTAHGREALRRTAGRADQRAEHGAERASGASASSAAAPRADTPWLAPAEHRTAQRAAAAVAAPELSPAPLPPPPPGHGVEGAILRSAAHLRIDTGALGDLSLHLRLRDGSLHLRVEGEAAHLVETRAVELSRALAGEGFKLAAVELPSREGTGLGGGSSGPRGDSGGRQQAWNDAADAHRDPMPSPRAAGRNRGETGAPPRHRHGGHHDVEA